MSRGERQFWQHFEANTGLYERIFALVHDMADAGHQRWSIKAAFEAARYLHRWETVRTDGYELNNNHTAWAGRLFHLWYPERAYMIVLRQQQT